MEDFGMERASYVCEDKDTIYLRILDLREQGKRRLIGSTAPETASVPALRCSCPHIGGYGEAFRRTVDSCDLHRARARMAKIERNFETLPYSSTAVASTRD